jgi:hypothetical protein
LTISPGPPSGPPTPHPESAGFSRYGTNELIHCPGTRPDRRHTPRGDRRSSTRPCGHSFGRVVSGAVLVRIQPTSGPESAVVVSCPNCTARVEFAWIASEAA